MMQSIGLTVERAVLHAALQRIARAIDPRYTIPILTHVLLQASDGTLRLTATNLDLDARISIAADIETPGACTVPGERFASIIAALPDGAQVTLNLSDAKLMVKSGRARFNLVTLDAKDFPDYGMKDSTHTFTIEAATLCELLSTTHESVSTAETQYHIGGVHLHALKVAGKPVLRAVGTDGYRMAKNETPVDKGAIGMPAVTIPLKAVKEIKSFAEKTVGDVSISLNDSKFSASFSDGSVLTSRLCEGEFMNYERGLLLENNNVISVDRKSLIGAVARVSAMSSDPKVSLRLDIEDGKIAVSLRNPDHGDSQDEIEADYSGDPIAIGYNARFLSQILGVLSADSILIKISDPAAPTILQNVGSDGLLMFLGSVKV